MKPSQKSYLLSDKMINDTVIPIAILQHNISNMSNRLLHMKEDHKRNSRTLKKQKLYFTNIQFIPGIWKDHENYNRMSRDTFTYNGYNSGNMIFLQLAKTFSELPQRMKSIRTIRF